jgi:hypothetical protein
MSNIFKKIFSNKTKKKRSSPGIEMQEIPYLKRLGKRTSSKKRTTSKKTTISIPRTPPSRRRVTNKNKKIYRERVKKSICRGKQKEVCINFCKFTKGPLRKYCRKSKNDRIHF